MHQDRHNRHPAKRDSCGGPSICHIAMQVGTRGVTGTRRFLHKLMMLTG